MTAVNHVGVSMMVVVDRSSSDLEDNARAVS
jgi:hypothetical protein